MRLYLIGGFIAGVLLSKAVLANPDLYGQWQGTQSAEEQESVVDLSLSLTGDFELILSSALTDPELFWSDIGEFDGDDLPEVLVIAVAGTWEADETHLTLNATSMSLQMGDQSFLEEMARGMLMLMFLDPEMFGEDVLKGDEDPFAQFTEQFTDEEINTFFFVFGKLFLFGMEQAMLSAYQEEGPHEYQLDGDQLTVVGLMNPEEPFVLQRAGGTAVVATSWGQVKQRFKW